MGLIAIIEREAAAECRLESGLGLSTRAEFGGIGIGLEPLERLGAERNQVVSLPVLGQQAFEERPEPAADRLGIGFVSGRLERDSIGQEGVFERILEGWILGSPRRGDIPAAPGRQDAYSYQTAGRADQRLPGGDLVLA